MRPDDSWQLTCYPIGYSTVPNTSTNSRWRFVRVPSRDTNMRVTRTFSKVVQMLSVSRKFQNFAPKTKAKFFRCFRLFTIILCKRNLNFTEKLSSSFFNTGRDIRSVAHPQCWRPCGDKQIPCYLPMRIWDTLAENARFAVRFTNI